LHVYSSLKQLKKKSKKLKKNCFRI